MDAFIFILSLLVALFCYLLGFYAARKDNEKEAVEFYKLGCRHEEIRRVYWDKLCKGEIIYKEYARATQVPFDIWKGGFIYKDIKKCLS